MKTYFFKVYNRERKKISLTLDFENSKEFHRYIKRNRFTLVEYRVAKRVLKVSKGEILLFTQNLKTLLESGLTITQALEMLGEESNTKISGVIQSIKLKIIEGNTLYSSFLIYRDIFGESYLNILLAGEESGKLVQNLDRICEKLLFEMGIKRKIKEALFYPSIILVFTFVLLTFILTFVFPSFIEFFKDTGTELPLLTKGLIFISRNFFKFIFMLVIISLVSYYIWKRLDRIKIENYKLRIPIYGRILKKSSIVEFCKNFSIMSEAGIDIIEIFEILERGTPYIFLKKELKNIQIKLKIGSSIKNAFLSTSFFSITQLQLIEVGEKGGVLEKSFGSIAFTMEKELESYLFKLTSLLEPILLLILGIIVGVIILGLYLPILNISEII